MEEKKVVLPLLLVVWCGKKFLFLFLFCLFSVVLPPRFLFRLQEEKSAATDTTVCGGSSGPAEHHDARGHQPLLIRGGSTGMSRR